MSLSPSRFSPSSKTKWAFLALTVAVSSLATPAHAYVDLAPTLAKIITDSRSISVVRVTEFNRESRTITYEEIKNLKGEKLTGPLVHQVAASPTAAIPRPVMQWAAVGAQGMLFSGPRTALVCVGEGWYQVRNTSNTWKLDVDRQELTLAYYGSVSRLIEGVDRMIQGRDVTITSIPHGVDGAATFDLALNRSAFPGLVKVQRIRANMKMPMATAMISTNPSYMMGMGPVDEADLPALATQLKAADAPTRAEAADDIRQMTDILGRNRTAFLAPALVPLLKDGTPRVRLMAASALLRLDAANGEALAVLTAGLQDKATDTRRDAAQASGVAGKGAGALVAGLEGLLKDKDESVRVAALQAMATLGPVAVSAKAAVVPMLDDPEVMIDAADCLGRMGPKAQPVPAGLIKMLSSDQALVRWAAVRGISQIGGPEAKPALAYMTKVFSDNVTETDAYNMLVYFALLGPVASEAQGALQYVPQLNPALPAATRWAMNPEQGLPAQTGLGGPGGMGGGPGDVGGMIWEAFVNELGERLRPAALTILPQILTGNRLTMPTWGYKILAAAPEETLKTLTPALGDGDVAIRERAAMALGFMGPAGAPAKGALEAAMQKAPNEREKKLIEWSLREITRD